MVPPGGAHLKIGAIILFANAEDDDLLAHTGHGTGAHWHFRAVWTSRPCAPPSFAVLGWGARGKLGLPPPSAELLFFIFLSCSI